MIPLSYNFRSLMVRKTTTIATALGIGLVVFVLASSQMLANGVRETMGKTGSADKALILRKGADTELSSTVEQRFISTIAATPGVKQTSAGTPIVSGEVLVVLALDKPGKAGQISNVEMRGIADNSLELRPEVRVIAGRPIRAGTDEVMVGKRVRGQYKGTELGQRFEIKKNRSAEVVGVFEADGSSFESEIWGGVDLLRTSFGRGGVVSSVTVALQSATKFDAFREQLERDKQLDLQVLRESDYFEKQSEGTAKLISGLGGAVVFFFSIGAMIGAMITMYGAVANRMREVGTLRALGFGRFTILLSFLIESVLLALLGAAAGALASLAMTLVHFSMINQNTFSEMVFSFTPTPTIIVGAMLVGGLMGVFGGLLPAVRAARISPIAAMRGN
jgi:putative ABC transport system permease protein